MRGIHQSLVDSSHNGQWHRPLIFSLIFAWTNVWKKTLRCQWFETPSRSLWRHCNVGSPGCQQPWCWLCMMNEWSSTRGNINYLCAIFIYFLFSDGEEWTLQIAHVRPSDAGVYQCGLSPGNYGRNQTLTVRGETHMSHSICCEILSAILKTVVNSLTPSDAYIHQ